MYVLNVLKMNVSTHFIVEYVCLIIRTIVYHRFAVRLVVMIIMLFILGGLNYDFRRTGFSLGRGDCPIG